MPKELPSPELLRKLLRYDAKTGKLFWLERTPDMFKVGNHSKEHSCRQWNSRFSGKEATGGINTSGYFMMQVLGRKFPAHRIAWAIYYNAWPKLTIDHINRCKTDNRIENLRDVSNVQNCRNKGIHSLNKSGVTGVSRNRSSWRAQIGCHGTTVNLGSYKCIEDAARARKEAEKRLWGF